MFPSVRPKLTTSIDRVCVCVRACACVCVYKYVCVVCPSKTRNESLIANMKFPVYTLVISKQLLTFEEEQREGQKAQRV